MKGSSAISNLIPKPTHPLILFSDVAFESSKITVILSDNDISHGLSRNVTRSVSISRQSVENNCKDTLKKLRINNLNRVIISQINKNSIRNTIELLSEVALGNQNWSVISD